MRHSGRLQSVDPAAGLLSLEEIGADGVVAIRAVRFRRATVVHATRRPAQPWEWHDSPTQIFRRPAGTFMTAIGTRTPSGEIDAHRIEVPTIE